MIQRVRSRLVLLAIVLAVAIGLLAGVLAGRDLVLDTREEIIAIALGVFVVIGSMLIGAGVGQL